MCTRLSNLRTTGNFKIEKKCYEGIRERGSHAKMAGSEVIHASLAGEISLEILKNSLQFITSFYNF